MITGHMTRHIWQTFGDVRWLQAGYITLLLCCAATPAAAEDASDACASLASSFNLSAPLPRTKAKLDAKQGLKIVALGSSSTTGFGTLGPGFPEVMQGELQQFYSGQKIELVNSGRWFDTIEASAQRLDRDVLRQNPDLMIWQVGTNDALRGGASRASEAVLRKTIRRVKASNVDVILMDLQYAPAIRATGEAETIEKLISAVARDEHVALFPRYRLMQTASTRGVEGLVAFDGLHNSGEGYRCIGLALARMIRNAVAP
ncbi:MAG TPA: GDSL-type esterase/lipase family protein [Pseudolabrys sp.]|nr:GDSL-type esterase/lipase family protein [Pseudolabrys sp.]